MCLTTAVTRQRSTSVLWGLVKWSLLFYTKQALRGYDACAHAIGGSEDIVFVGCPCFCVRIRASYVCTARAEVFADQPAVDSWCMHKITHLLSLWIRQGIPLHRGRGYTMLMRHFVVRTYALYFEDCCKALLSNLSRFTKPHRGSFIMSGMHTVSSPSQLTQR